MEIKEFEVNLQAHLEYFSHIQPRCGDQWVSFARTSPTVLVRASTVLQDLDGWLFHFRLESFNHLVSPFVETMSSGCSQAAHQMSRYVIIIQLESALSMIWCFHVFLAQAAVHDELMLSLSARDVPEHDKPPPWGHNILLWSWHLLCLVEQSVLIFH